MGRGVFTIEQEGSVDQQGESENLEGLEGLPVERQAENPDEQGPASIDDTPGGGADAPCNTDTEEVEATNRDHDRDGRKRNSAVAGDLAESLNGVKVSVLALGVAANGNMEDNHSNDGDNEAKNTLPANNLQWLKGVVLEDPFLSHELGCGEDLGTSDEENTDDGSEGSAGGVLINRGIVVEFGDKFLFFEEGSSKTDDSNTENDDKQREPLEGTEVALQEQDREKTNKEDKGSTGHLVD